MKSTTILRLFAYGLALVGALLIRTAGHDPAPRDAWQWHRGPLAEVEFVDTQKAGQRCRIRLDGDVEQFARDHLQEVPGLREMLQERLQVGSAIAVAAMPRGAGGMEAATPQPLPMLRLEVDDHVLFDRGGEAGQSPVVWLVRLGGGAAILLAATLIVLLWRMRRARTS